MGYEKREAMLAEGNLLDACIDLIVSTGGVSIVELQRLVGTKIDTNGDHAISLGQYENILLWEGMSEEFSTLLQQILKDERVEAKGTTPLVYMIDGVLIKRPLAKRAHNYKDIHWYPIVFNTRLIKRGRRKK